VENFLAVVRLRFGLVILGALVTNRVQQIGGCP
jgi:hypothetical protein